MRLLTELHHGPASSGLVEADLQRIQTLARLGDANALPALLLLALRPALASAVAAAAGQILATRSSLQLSTLDHQLRGWPGYTGAVLGQWNRLSSQEVPFLTNCSQGEWLLAALCSHRNGRVRELAVKLLAQRMHTGREIAFLAMRLNDWVEPIRQAAAQALSERLQDAFLDEWVDCLPLLERSPPRRTAQAELLAIQEFLGRAHVLRRGLNSPNGIVRGCALRLGVGRLPDEEIVGRGLSDSNQTIQTWATRLLRQARVSTEFVTPLLRHANPAVRVAALMRCQSAPPPMLLDSSPRVREAARRLFPNQNFAELYRQHLDCKAGVAGLGEVGCRADAALLAPLCTHPRLARVAVKALARLDAEGHVQLFSELLAHPAVGLARQAFLALLPLAGGVMKRCRSLARHGPAHSRRLALNLLERASKWESLALLVELRHDPEVSLECQKLLQRWLQNYNKRQIPPSPGQLRDLRDRADLPQELSALLNAL